MPITPYNKPSDLTTVSIVRYDFSSGRHATTAVSTDIQMCIIPGSGGMREFAQLVLAGESLFTGYPVVIQSSVRRGDVVQGYGLTDLYIHRIDTMEFIQRFILSEKSELVL